MASLNRRVDDSLSEEQSSGDQRLRFAKLDEDPTSPDLLQRTRKRPAAEGAAEVGGVAAVGPEGDAGGSTRWKPGRTGGKARAQSSHAQAQPGWSDGRAATRPPRDDGQSDPSATGPGAGTGAASTASAAGTNDSSSDEGWDGGQGGEWALKASPPGRGTDVWAAYASAIDLDDKQPYKEGGNGDDVSRGDYWNSPVLAPPPLPLCNANANGGHWVTSPLGGENGQYPCYETPKKPTAAETALFDVDERDLLSFSPLVDFDQCPCSEDPLSLPPLLGGENGQYPCPETPRKPERPLLDADERDKENSPYRRAPGNVRDLLSFSQEHGVTFWGVDDLAGCPHRLADALAARDLYEENANFLFPALHPLGQEYLDGGPILPPLIFDTSRPPTAANMGLPEDCSPEVARRIADGWLLALMCRFYYLNCPHHKNNDREIQYYRRWVWFLVESGKDFGTVLGLCGKPGNEVDLSCGANEGCLKKYNACHSVKSAKKILNAIQDLVQLDPESRFGLNLTNFRAICAWTLEDVKSRGSLSCPLPTADEMWAKAAVMNVMIWLCPKIRIGNKMTDEEKAQGRERNAARKRERWNAMTEEAKREERDRNAQAKRGQWARKTEEEKAAQRAKNAQRKRDKWATLSDEQKAVERARNAGRKKAKRAG